MFLLGMVLGSVVATLVMAGFLWWLTEEYRIL